MVSKEKILKFILLFALLYFLVFFILNSLEFWYWLKREIQSAGIFGSPEVTMRQEKKITFQEEEVPFTEKENSIEIPKIGIEAPLVLIGDPQTEDFKKALDRGVVLHPESVLPGEKGELFVLGHSAPSGWPQIRYDWVFSRLNELESGDEVFINFQKRRHTFVVTQKIFLERGEEIPEYSESQESTLYLISCWPPGRDLRRIAVKALSK